MITDLVSEETEPAKEFQIGGSSLALFLETKLQPVSSPFPVLGLGFLALSLVMDLTPETDEYIRESIEDSVGLRVPARTLCLKLIASEDERRRLQDQIFLLGDRLDDAERRLDECRVEASMNALELKKCIEEKAAMISEHRALTEHCAALEEECSLYERNFKRLMEVCDELGKENDALQARLQDNSVVRLVDEIGSLKQDKQQLRINLCRAEDEVKALFEENKLLDQVNRRLLRQFKKEQQHQETDDKRSAGASVEGRPKSTLKEGNPEQAPGPQNTGPPRQPLSPLQHN
ncbi:hypothetical protein DsansV1_C15g0135541 [Dioscorea sansibarensis]